MRNSISNRFKTARHPVISRHFWLAALIGIQFFSSPLHAEPVVLGDIISWPDDGWYQVQNADDFTTVCEGGRSCQVPPGRYNVINHDTGERFESLQIGTSTNGHNITWPDDGWYQVQALPDYTTVCEGGTGCTVEPGNYILVNHTTGTRSPAFSVSAATDDSTPDEEGSPSLPISTLPGETLVLNLVGTGLMYEDLVPAADGLGELVTAWCFDVDLIDLKTGINVGSSTDCLDPSLGNQRLSGNGLALIGTTYFNLPNGMLAIQGRTTVQPINWPTREFTHITGGNSAANAVLYGTGQYEGVSGTARLSGMVDLSRFNQTPGTPINFDCIFIINLSG